MFETIRILKNSLLVWIVALVIFVQLSILGLAFAYLNFQNSDPRYDQGGIISKTQYVSLIFENLVGHNKNNDDFSSMTGLPGSEAAAWSDIVSNNPDFWYYYSDGVREIYGGAPGFVDRNLLTSVQQVLPAGGGCIDFDLSRREGRFQVHSIVFICDDEAPIFFEVGGLSPDYTPPDYWFQAAIGPTFNSRMLVQSYLVVLALTPVLLFFIISPLRRVSRMARNLSPSIRNQRLPLLGVFSEMRGVVDSINDALARIDRGFSREQQLRNAVAHELRTPLTVLRARLEDLPDSTLRDELVADARRLKDQINRIMDFAKAAQNAEIAVPLNLVSETRAACAACSRPAMQLGIEVDLRPAAEIVMVKADKTAIALILENVLNNCLLHGGSTTTVTVSVEAEGDVVISDNGQGLPNDLIEVVSNYPETDYYESRYEQIGFGFIIIFELLRLVSGTISCRNRESGGAEFRIGFVVEEPADKR